MRLLTALTFQGNEFKIKIMDYKLPGANSQKDFPIIK